jgi:hypothetical protein
MHNYNSIKTSNITDLRMAGVPGKNLSGIILSSLFFQHPWQCKTPPELKVASGEQDLKKT